MLSASKIFIKRSSTPGSSPAINQLESGELALNLADKKIFFKNNNGTISFIDQSPYTFLENLSSLNFKLGGNTVTGAFGSVLQGYNNDVSGSGSTTINGENNDITGDFALIGNGLNNTIGINGDYSAILGGKNNTLNHQESFIIGSNITSHLSGFTYVNNLSVLGKIYGDGSNLTGITGGGSGVDTEVRALTSNWQSTYTTVQTNSANWGAAASGTLSYELSVIDTTQGIYKNGDLIPAGTSIETILINMLKTSVPPTYSYPTLSVAYGSPSVIGTYEIGSTVSGFTVSPTFISNDSGGLIDFVYYKDSTNLGTGSTKAVSSFTISSTTTLQVSAGYSQGPIKNDNLGNPYPTGRISGGALTNSATLNAIYPYFYGKSSTLPTAASIASTIQNGLATKVLASANGNVSVTYNAVGEYIWFAHISTQTQKSTWYVTALNNGNIGSGQAINSPVTQSVTSPDAYWSGVSYKIYISSGLQEVTTLEYRN